MKSVASAAALTMFLAAGCGDSTDDNTGGGGGGEACPGSDVVCAEHQLCQADPAGQPPTCVAACEPGAACGERSCCAAGATCVDTECVAPDLVLSDLGPEVITFSGKDFAEDACEVASGCVAGAGRRNLIHFSTRLENVGAGALRLGVPEQGSLFQPSFCEGAYVIPRFLHARLLKDGEPVRETHLAARCIASEDGGFDCEAQGLAPQGSTELPDTSCNHIDATGLAAGAFELELTVNPDGVLAESNFDNNTISVPVSYPACDGTMCGGGCCPDGVECLDDVCMLPNLRVNEQSVVQTVTFSHQSFLPDSCEVEEACVAGPGRRHLLQFESNIENAGPGHLNPGPEEGNPLFHLDECHGHYHFLDFADYKLIDRDDRVVAQGHKQSFCVVDIAPLDPANPAPHGEPPPGSAGCNFLSAGWADIYGVGTPCQWVDVTGVPEGDYTLRVAVNPLGKIDEASQEDNVVEIPVHVPADTPCVPVPEICGDFIDQDCDDIPDNGCDDLCFPQPEFCGDNVDDNCNGVPDDGCTPLTGTDTCATAGELTASMSYSAVITASTQSDVTLPCGGAGRDVFFHFSLAQEEVVYLSSFTSDMDTTMALYSGSDCGGTPLVCSSDACGPLTSSTHLAVRLLAGDYYVVVKAADAADEGTVRLKYEHTTYLGDASIIDSPGLIDGDTTGAPVPPVSQCGPPSPQQSFYLTMCPGASIGVSSCGLTTFPMAFEIAPKASNQTMSVCSLDDDGCAADPDGGSIMTWGGDWEGSLGAVTVGGRTPVHQGPYTLFIDF